MMTGALLLLIIVFILSDYGSQGFDFSNSPDFVDMLVKQSIDSNNSGDVTLRPTVTISDGTKFQGLKVDSIYSFKGLRFGEAPVGHLRWAPPQPWKNPDPSTVIDASRYRSACVQGISVAGRVLGDEDCLFLNIWVPESAIGRNLSVKLPVAIFVHGGSYNTGTGAMYSGADMVRFFESEAIMVTVNYRLNVFGFLGSEELRKLDKDSRTTGNQGLQDQRLAFQWVQKNIGAFGGDNKRVMIFGESAGAGSVSNHLVMKRSWGLYQSAAMESGSFSDWITQPMAVAEKTYGNLLTVTGCNDIDCLVALSTQQILELSMQVEAAHPYPYPYVPTADGVEINTHPWLALERGEIADVPIMHGTNRDEGAIFLSMPKDGSYADLVQFWKSYSTYNFTFSNEDIVKLTDLYVYQQYPDTAGSDRVSQYFWAAARSAGDNAFSCAARHTSQQLLALPNRKSATFLYHFEHPRQNMRFVSHFSEVPYVFNWGYIGFNNVPDQEMADVMTTLWGNFIISNNPTSRNIGVKDVPSWPAFSAIGQETYLLPSKEGIVTANGIKQRECNFIIPILDSTIRNAFSSQQ